MFYVSLSITWRFELSIVKFDFKNIVMFFRYFQTNVDIVKLKLGNTFASTNGCLFNIKRNVPQRTLSKA